MTREEVKKDLKKLVRAAETVKEYGGNEFISFKIHEPYFRTLIDTILAYLSEAEWTRSEISMPAEGDEVLVTDGRYMWIDESQCVGQDENGYLLCWGDGHDFVGTAWRYLPEMPDLEEKKDDKS